MAKVSKHRKMKRATVLIKRTQCIKNKKVVQTKSYTPLYQKLKMNNRVLARTLSQEKQEKQFMFTRILELTAEVQNLTNACNSRDHFIANVLNISKDMVQMIVTMSEYLTNTISSCQNFLSNRANKHLTSSSSTGRRESSKRLSTKSPARGVVKPMVSGHTITKPTINLSRVNMQRLPNVNLTIIEEASNASERSLDRSSEGRRSHRVTEQLRRTSIRNEDDEERVINRVNRRTNRYSSSQFSKRHSNRLSGEGLPNRLSNQNTNRLSIEGHPSRLSKRNPTRLSEKRLSSRLSKHSSEFSELSKNPRVTLLDVSRYLSNNQSINIKSLTNNACTTNNVSMVEDTEASEQSGPETGTSTTIIPETQAYNDSSEDSEHGNNATTTRKKSSSNINERNSRSDIALTTSLVDDSEFDPMEGPSWMFSNESNQSIQCRTNSVECKKSSLSLKNDKASTTRKTEVNDSFNAREHNTWMFDSDSDSESEEEPTHTSGKVRTLSNSRDYTHNSSKKLMNKSYEWSKRASLLEYPKSPLNNMSTEETKSAINDNGDISRRPDESPVSSLSPDRRRSFLHKSGLPKSFARSQTSRLNIEEDLLHADTSGINGLDTSNNWSKLPNGEVEENPMCFITRHRGGSNRLPPQLCDDDDEDTLLINMNRQMAQETPQANRDRPEQLQYDVNELLQLTPFKPLLNINKINRLIQPEVEAEHTATVQISQRIPLKTGENSDTLAKQSTIVLSRPEIPAMRLDNFTEASTSRHNKSINDMTTIKMGSKVELPRLTEMHNTSDDNNEQQNQYILIPDKEKPIEVPILGKRKRVKRVEIKYCLSEDEENEVPVRGKGKSKQRKKETKAKDPSCAKVVLQKLNESHRQSTQSENNVSSTSARSVADQISQSHDYSSDSDSSSISHTSRPRRNKAPKNLKEPSLHRKLRR